MLTEDFHDSSAVLALISHSKVISFVWCSLLHYPMILFFKEELLELIFYTCSHFEEIKITKYKKYLKLLSKISNIEIDLFFFYFFNTLDKQIIFSGFVQIVFTRFDFCIGSVFLFITFRKQLIKCSTKVSFRPVIFNFILNLKYFDVC